jgi:hypothetical protein
MHQTKTILCCLGIVLIIVGFVMIVYGESRLNVAYMCPSNGCNFSPEIIYQIYTIPTIIVYSGLAMIIVGGICIIIGRRK